MTSLRAAGLWPPVIPSVVLVECLTGRGNRDANVNRFLKSCAIDPVLLVSRARRAADLRARARKGSAVDAVAVATAEPGGTVLTGDTADLNALARHADTVFIRRI